MRRGLVLITLGILLMSGLFSGCASGKQNNDGADYARLREKMVKTQLVQRGVADSNVLKAMRTVKRHLFVPEAQRSAAYNDYPLPIGEGQTISQPYIVAFMTELLAAHEDSRVLEIGTGSGYQAAVLAKIAKEVWTIEIIEALGRSAETRLKELGYENVHVRIGDGYAGWPEHAPFDGIIVTCACREAPGPLVAQLGEGGRMVVPIGRSLSYQTLTLFEKKNGALHKKDISGCVFVPLLGPHGWVTGREK